MFISKTVANPTSLTYCSEFNNRSSCCTKEVDSNIMTALLYFKSEMTDSIAFYTNYLGADKIFNASIRVLF